MVFSQTEGFSPLKFLSEAAFRRVERLFSIVLLPALFALAAVFLTASAANAQDKYSNENGFRLFNPATAGRQQTKEIEAACNTYSLIQPIESAYADLLQRRPRTLNLVLPTPFGNRVLNLQTANILSADVKFTEHSVNGIKQVDYNPGLYYQGQMQGDSLSRFAISFFDNGQIIGVGWGPGFAGNMVIGRIKSASGKAGEGEVIVYTDNNLNIKNPFECGTSDIVMPANGYEKRGGVHNNSSATTCKAVSSYWEGGNTFYTAMGSNITTANNYLTALFNIVNQLYNAEQLNHILARVQINTGADATDLTTQKTVLSSFGSRMNGTLTENLGHYFTGNYSTFGGLAWVDQLCVSAQNFRTATSNLKTGLLVLPTYSFDAQVTTHEMGHNLGSQHTQWCGWDKGNGVFGTIDSCVAAEPVTAGTTACYTGPSIGRTGTIMSYCHILGTISFTLGFGPMPGAIIRDRFTNATCLSGTAPPSVAVTGPSGVCYGDNFTLSVPALAGATYTWAGPGSFTAGTNSITRTSYTDALAGDYTATVTINGCTYTSFPKNISAQTLAISNPVKVASLCAGALLPFAASFNCTTSASTSIVVQLSNALGSWATPTVLGTFTNTGTVNTNLSGTSTLAAGNYRLRVLTTFNGITKTSKYILGVGIAPLSATPGNVSATICSGSPATLTAPVGASSRNWYDSGNNLVSTDSVFTTPPISSNTSYYLSQVKTTSAAFGKTAVSGGGVRSVASNFGNWFRVYNTCTITGFTVNADAAGTGVLGVIDSLTKSTVTTRALTFAAGNNVITGLNVKLSPGVYKLAATATVNLYRNASGAGYPYRLAGICEILGADDGNTGNNSVNAYYWFYNIGISYQGCESAKAVYTLNTQSIPQPLVTASGPVSFCAGGIVTLSAPAGFGYIWSNGATTQSIIVGLPGTYTVKTTSSGCTSAASESVNVTVNSIPAMPEATSSGTVICSGAAVVLSSNSATGNLWSTGAQTQSISVSSAGNYFVNVIAAGCTSAPSNVISISTGNRALDAGTISGVNFLHADTTANYTVPPIANADSYNWTYSGTGVSIINSGNTAALVFAPNAVSGVLSVSGVSASCGTGSSASMPITIYADTLPDLYISGIQSIGGVYRSVFVSSNSVITLNEDLDISGVFNIIPGSVLNTNCHNVTGTGSFILSPGATLTICNASGISASGNTGAVQTGTRSFSNAANYEYNGLQEQITGNGLPGRVQNLSINNAAGVSLTSLCAVSRILKLESGNLETNNKLKLLSDSAGTAMVVNVNGTSSGEAVVERYISPGINPGFGYRHYSSAVSGQKVSELSANGTFSPVLNYNYNTAAIPGAVIPYPNVFAFADSRITSLTNNFNSGWYVPAGILQAGQGISVNIQAAKILKVTGVLNNGNYNVSAESGGTTNSGWLLTGNPYPAPINWTMVNTTNMYNAVFTSQSTGQYAGRYAAYVNGIGNNGGSPIIASMQGFFVRAKTGGGTVSFTNAARLTSYSSPSFYRNQTPDLIRLELSSSGFSGDQTTIYFEEGATELFNPEKDAGKLQSGGISLYSISTDDNYSIKCIDLQVFNGIETRIPLGYIALAEQRHTISAIDVSGFWYIKDSTDAQLHSLPYSFATRAGRFNNRFQLVKINDISGLSAATAQPLLFPNPNAGIVNYSFPGISELNMYDAAGRAVLKRTVENYATLDLKQFTAGIYFLHCISGGNTYVRKVVRQ